MNCVRRRRNMGPLLLAVLVCIGINATAEAIDPNDYSNSAEIKFQGYTGTTPLTNFPALFEFTDGFTGFRYSDMESDDYSDLRFTKDDGITSIPFEVEKWNSTLVAADPSSISGCRLWLKADAGVQTNASGSVTNWIDYSGTGHHATTALTNEYPSLQSNTLNNLPVIRFDGIDDRLNYDGSFLAQTDYTIFIVEGRLDDSTSYVLRGTTRTGNQNLHVGYRNNTTFTHAQYGNDYNMSVPGFSTQVFKVYALDHGAAKHTWLNGELLGSKANPTPLSSYNGANIGGNGTYNGEVAEVIMYNRTLCSTERNGVHRYLEEKYGIAMSYDRTSQVWVQVPELTNNASIFAYWGNTNATEIPAYTTNGATWSENYAAVYHLSETNGLRMDSTANARNGEPVNEVKHTEGITSGGARFDGNNDWIDLPNNFGQFGNQPVTVALWFNAEVLDTANRVVFCGGGEHSFFLTFADTQPSDTIGLRINDGGWKTPVKKDDVAANRWYHIAATWDPATGYLMYADGTQTSSSPLTAARTTRNGDNNLGCLDGGSRYFRGSLDEVRVSTVVRSSDWVKACNDNQSAPTAFSTVMLQGYYDTDPAAGLQSGNGEWSTTNAVWNPAEDGSGTLHGWDNGAHAWFEADGSSAISVDSVTAQQMLINGTGYTFSDGTIKLNAGIIANESVTINSALTIENDQQWVVASNRTLTLRGNGAGNKTLVKTGPGTLNISRMLDYSGMLRIEEGQVVTANFGWWNDPMTRGPVWIGPNAKLHTTAGWPFGAVFNKVITVEGEWQADSNVHQYQLEFIGGKVTGYGGRLGTYWGGGGVIRSWPSETTALLGGNFQLFSSIINFDINDGPAAVDLLVPGNLTYAGGAPNNNNNVTKNGAGVLELRGNSTYTGGTTINAGTLLVNNTAGSGLGTGAVTINGGTLGGTGSVANAVSFGAGGGSIAPGSSTGALTVNSNVVFTSTGTKSLDITINGTGQGEYSSLAVNGALTLDDATLNVSLGLNIPGRKKLVIIENDGTDAVTGTFAGLPEGSTFKAGGENFIIYYAADAASGNTSGGNDVMLVSAEEGTLLIVE